MLRSCPCECSVSAKERGPNVGRPVKLTANQRHEAVTRGDEDPEPLAGIGGNYNVRLATISRLSKGAA